MLVLVYLGCFSLGTLTPWSGLFVTGGALLLVGAFMLLYARRTPAPGPLLSDATDKTAGQVSGRAPAEEMPHSTARRRERATRWMPGS